MKPSIYNVQETPELTLVQRLQNKEPDRNVVFTAIEQLKTPEEIKEFYQEYIEWLKTNTELSDPEKVAKENIGYVIGYYSQETANTWMKTLEDIYHPVFGREIPYGNPISAFEAGMKA